MSEVVSVRVKREIKELLEREGIDVGAAIRNYLEEMAWRIKVKRGLEKLDEMLREMPPASRGFSARSVREDRDSR
ncbi:VapB-type antitoxin [Candidatus Bathyarchaeota archaeon]|nr:MAG: VapB-type antitoxin [Candidatus Bathyarchaeota archaeon]